MGWRDELIEVTKSQAEREAEEEARRQKRLAEALEVADAALELAFEALKFAHERLEKQDQDSSLEELEDSGRKLRLGELTVSVQLSRTDAVLKVDFNEGRPREFDFGKDRHLAPKDVEDYVGRRVIELARTAQKNNPW